MTALNSVHLIGRFTKDPDYGKTASGKSKVNFTLAVYRDKDHTDFINCVAWNGTADLIYQRMRKGTMMSAEGVISTRSWNDNYGKKHWLTEVNVSNIGFVEGKKENGTQNSYSEPQANEFAEYESIINDDDLPY